MDKLSKELEIKLINELKEANHDKEKLDSILNKYKDYKLSNFALKEVFLCYYQINESGYSKVALMSDLINIHPSFLTTNGGDWCRSDQSPLGKEYIIVRERKKGSIYSVKLDGFNKRLTEKHRGISETIRKALRSKKCVILQVGTNIEIDHKNGKYNDRELENFETQKLEDFQPLSKSANDAKRQHCKECKSTNKRFDAKRLGYKESYIMGDESSMNCDGCYWHDPYKFNSIISKDFNKEL